MKLLERIQKGCNTFKKKEIDPIPNLNPPGAPPPPDGPILNTKKDYELDNTPNLKDIDESYNPKKKRGTVGSNKNVFKIKKLLKSKPR